MQPLLGRQRQVSPSLLLPAAPTAGRHAQLLGHGGHVAQSNLQLTMQGAGLAGAASPGGAPLPGWLWHLAWAVPLVLLALVVLLVWLCCRSRRSPECSTPGGWKKSTHKMNLAPPTVDRVGRALCPTLVSKPGREAMFALKENTFSSLPRASSAIRDQTGNEVAIVEGTCIGCNDRLRIRGTGDRRDLLAEVCRDRAEENSFSIFDAHGHAFGTLEMDTVEPGARLTSPAGVRLLTFEGDFSRREFAVWHGGRRDAVAQVGHGFFVFEPISHYQVRVAGGADAGLVMLCCLVIDEAL